MSCQNFALISRIALEILNDGTVCGQICEVIGRITLESTDGPVEHIKSVCLAKHHLFMPEDMLGLSSQDGLTLKLTEL